MITPNEIIKQEELTSNPWILFEQLLKERDSALEGKKVAELRAEAYREVAILEHSAECFKALCVDVEAARIMKEKGEYENFSHVELQRRS